MIKLTALKRELAKSVRQLTFTQLLGSIPTLKKTNDSLKIIYCMRPVKKIFLTSLLLLFTALEWQTTAAAVVLQYHHISTSTPAITSIPPEQFKKHVNYLVNNNFETISTVELARLLEVDSPKLDDSSVYLATITFDDGYDSILTEALPILRQHKLPFTIFVNPNLVGTKGYLKWQQLAQIQTQGATIANHTLNHPHLIRKQENETDKQWQRRITQEIVDAEKAIESNLGVSHKQLAYPFGEYNQKILEIVHELGFIAFSQHSGAVGTSSNHQALPRFAFGGDYGELQTFIDKVNSVPMPLTRVEVKTEAGKLLESPLLPMDVSRPRLHLSLNQELLPTCYASGQGKINITTAENQSYIIEPIKDLPTGRSRYNCTAPTGVKGRFYWYSQPFYRKLADGSWYPEY